MHYPQTVSLLDAPAGDELAGHVLASQYEVQEVLGKGAFGVVYRAVQRSTGQLVALKLLRASESTLSELESSLRHELALSAQLHHPHIVRLIDSGFLHRGSGYGVFEYVPGETLASRLWHRGPLRPKQTKRIMSEVLDALACAHARGIVHRDVKPANIMISETGARLHAKVLDFGIGLVSGHLAAQKFLSADRIGGLTGTPGYMSPEQLGARSVSAASDLYAWGLVAVECMTGRPVIAQGSVAEILFAQMSSKTVPLPEWLEEHDLGKLLGRVLRKDPGMRPREASDLLDELDDIYVGDLEEVWESCGGAKPAANLGTMRSSWRPPSASVAIANQHCLDGEARESSVNLAEEAARNRCSATEAERRRPVLRSVVQGMRRFDGSGLDAALTRLTQGATELFEVSRASIWLLAGTELRCLKLWDRRTGRPEEGGRLTATFAPRYFRALEEGIAIDAEDVFTDPRTIELVDYFSPLGIISMLDAPIVCHGVMAGVICHEHTGTARRWTADDVDDASRLGELASAAFAAYERHRIRNVLSGLEGMSA